MIQFVVSLKVATVGVSRLGVLLTANDVLYAALLQSKAGVLVSVVVS